MAELGALFLTCFAAATLIPLPSEAALWAYMRLNPDEAWLAVSIATLGNTAGGMTTYLVGRLFPTSEKIEPRALRLIRRFGPPASLLAWLPIVGDGLSFAAGWLRLNWWAVLAFAATGRLARYIAIAAWAN